jgi:uncharacterized protein YdaU (DUF1376 family)
MSLPYYPMYPRDFYEGTMELSLEEKGAYIMLLNLMYTRGGPISDEADYIARYVGCSRVKWLGKKGSLGIRDRLIAAGKLAVEGGMLSNTRAAVELNKQASWRQQQAENGAGSNKNKDEEKRPLPHSKPEPKVEEQGSVARVEKVDFSALDANDLDALEDHVRKWANGSLAPIAGPLNLAPITKLIAGGCSIDDVKSGVMAGATSLHNGGRQTDSLEYFKKPILRARDDRLKPLPEPENRNERAGQSQSGANRNVRGRGGARSGGEHGASPYGAAWDRLFGGDQEATDVPFEPIDGRSERVA